METQSRSLDKRSSICNPGNTLKSLQQSPGHTVGFGANNHPCPQISGVLPASQLFLHAVFTQSRAICLSFSAPTSIIHFPILHLLSQTIGQNLTSTETCSVCLGLAGHPTACVGMKIHLIHWRQAYLVPALPCSAPFWESLSTKDGPSLSRTAMYPQLEFSM